MEAAQHERLDELNGIAEWANQNKSFSLETKQQIALYILGRINKINQGGSPILDAGSVVK